jgi:hypothetical protein
MRRTRSTFVLVPTMVLVACTGGSDPGTDAGSSGGSSGSIVSPKSDGGSTTTILTSEFDRSCSGDGDCAAVHQGSVCDACQCENGAIAKKDLTKYQSTVAERKKLCGSAPPPCAADCANPGVACTGGTCTIAVKPKDAGAE